MFAMMHVLLYSLAAIVGFVLLLFLLPVKIYGHSAGGAETQLTATGRIMVFAGLFGGGFEYRLEEYILTVRLLSWNALTFHIKPSGEDESEKQKKEKAEKKDEEKEKKPLTDRIRSFYGKSIKYKDIAAQTLPDLYRIIRIDRFSAYVRFGFSNPALTGKLIGIIFIVNGILPKPFKITQSWDFTKSTLNGELDARVTFFFHRFWITLMQRIPLIIGIIREHKREKFYSDNNTLAIQEV